MDALELADDIEPMYAYGGESLSFVASVLRQQQAEIEALRKADLTQKSLCKAEPVAWLFVLDGCRCVTLDEDASYEIQHNGTPLYTHPVKELTPCEELRVFQEQQNGVFSEHNACCYRHECRIVWNDWEKLRSNPVKELTDEKIMEYVEAFSIDMGDIYEFQPDNVLEMIKQILHKAQE